MRQWWNPNFDKRHALMAEEALDTTGVDVVYSDVLSPAPALDRAFMVPMYHRCGRLAFYYHHYPEDGEILRADHALLIDGRPVDPQAPMTCGTCGDRIENGWELKPACRQCGELRETCKGTH